MTKPRRTTSSTSPPAPARAASASSRATSSTAPPSSPPPAAAPVSSTSPPPAPWTASSTPRYTCRSPDVRPHLGFGSPARPSGLLWLQRQLMVPAVEGTLNVLRAAKNAGGVRRVVVTSSISSIVPNPGWPAGEVLDERSWTDIDYCEKNGVWYPASKTLAEKAAWKFAEENGLDVVVVNPGTVMGPVIPPRVNASTAILVRLLEGCTEEYVDFYMGPVHVEDVALAHILLFENPSASGRHLCVESIAHWSDFASKVAELYPNYKVPKFPKDTQPGMVRAEAASKKLIALGLQFSPMEKIIRDSVESLKSRGFVAS
ncbi:hypothetical protein GUJ93_ZPchr0003g17610 [Zizania palustris]|uniref:NAD-dependent epimerase/dehydratase domain-containing protein n=1 Tax=Zizania palustris TaxID=103762 RepID=A0A8J5RWN8_ZIZPA|nr:hypothetical protein GUJ93_ZPchr0003g17610 [Zizania palustris]